MLKESERRSGDFKLEFLGVEAREVDAVDVLLVVAPFN